MSNISSLKPKDVVKVLIALEYIFIRQKGSHQVYVKGDSIIIVPTLSITQYAPFQQSPILT